MKTISFFYRVDEVFGDWKKRRVVTVGDILVFKKHFGSNHTFRFGYVTKGRFSGGFVGTLVKKEVTYKESKPSRSGKRGAS